MENLAIPIQFLGLIFMVVAIGYSMAGLGGASTYLAILALCGASSSSSAPIGLACNIIVTLSSLIYLGRAGHICLPKLLPFLLTSVPAAFLGGYLQVREPVVDGLLAGSLCVASIYLFNFPRFSSVHPFLVPSQLQLWSIGCLSGGLIGLMSGMVGIGGGIFLVPLLYWLRWLSGRQIVAASSLFILANSIAGIGGHVLKAPTSIPFSFMLVLCVSVLVGSQIGSFCGAFRVKLDVIRNLTATLLLVASARIIWKMFG